LARTWSLTTYYLTPSFCFLSTFPLLSASFPFLRSNPPLPPRPSPPPHVQHARSSRTRSLAQVNAKTFLEKRYNDDIELEDAIHTAILTLKEGFEGQISENNIEIGVVNDQKMFRVLTPAEILDYLGEVE
jgi:hypothetical protein